MSHSARAAGDPPPAFCLSGSSAIIASVVTSKQATLAEFSSAHRTTLVGSITPALIRSPYSCRGLEAQGQTVASDVRFSTDDGCYRTPPCRNSGPEIAPFRPIVPTIAEELPSSPTSFTVMCGYFGGLLRPAARQPGHRRVPREPAGSEARSLPRPPARLPTSDAMKRRQPDAPGHGRDRSPDDSQRLANSHVG